VYKEVQYDIINKAVPSARGVGKVLKYATKHNTVTETAMLTASSQLKGTCKIRCVLVNR
jgi:hypothetical protein